MRTSNLIALAALFSLACTPGRESGGAGAVSAALATSDLAEQILDGHLEDPKTAAFGFGAAVYHDKALVGAPDYVFGESEPVGAIPFTKIGTTWHPEPSLLPPSVDELPFVDGLAVSDSFAALGASSVAGEVGSVWMFPREAMGWSEVPSGLVPPAGTTGTPRFGASLALEGDTLLVGALAMDVDVDQPAVGAVFVYAFSNGQWQQRQVLRPSGPDVIGSAFGTSVALLGDVAVVGAPFEGGAGAVYVYERGATWSEVKRLPAFEAASGFGKTVALSSELLFVGAPGEVDATGAAYAFSRNDGAWDQAKRLTSATGEIGDAFGRGLAVSRETLFVAAPFAISAGITSGRVEPFALDGTWTPLDLLVASDAADGDLFGRSLAASSSAVVVGGAGKAYVLALALGVPCEGDFDCNSGACSEGVCCDTPCQGSCRSCLGSNKPGGRGRDGICELVEAGSDPRDSCNESSTACRETGFCDAKGQCAFQAKGVTCGGRACNDSTHLQEESLCDGNGACVMGLESACETGYLCSDADCGNHCTQNEQCDTASGYYCFESSCVTGARCSVDRRLAFDQYGNVSTCDAQLCSDGECLPSCRRSMDCRDGLVCHPSRHQCVLPAELAAPEPDSGCTAHPRRRGSGWSAVWGLMALVGLRVVAFRRGVSARARSSPRVRD